MTIKPQILLRFLLFLPHFAWGIALSFIFLVIAPAGNTGMTNAVTEALGGVATNLFNACLNGRCQIE